MEKLIYKNTMWDISDEEILEGLEPEELEGLTVSEKERLADSYRETWRDDEFDNIKWLLKTLQERIKAPKYVVKGTVGLWNGPQRGIAIKNTLEDAFWFAVSDCELEKMTEEDGALNIEVSHHDGRNYFSIRPMSKKGYEYYDRHEYDSSMTDREFYAQFNREEFLRKIKIKKEEMI